MTELINKYRIGRNYNLLFHGSSTSPRVLTASITRSHPKSSPLSARRCVWNGVRVLDLGSGSGEMLCTWARDYGVIGTGIDMSQLFTDKRNSALKNSVSPIKSSSSMAMLPASSLTRRPVWQPVSVPRGSLGESSAPSSFWRRASAPEGSSSSANPTCWALSADGRCSPGVLPAQSPTFSCFQNFSRFFGHLGYDVVEMVLADQDSWDRYEAAKWLTMRRWLEANPDDEFAKDVRAKLILEPERYAAYTREYLGWGVLR